ncbi:MAG: hypothetical protein F6K17_06705 [Okeania sp. SIO3C4]|nr:hypothetical protein [Okeania sp. SIO3B3]NER02342.1 hypothetical protein [Okeania sp. SIO3C4]
MDSGMGIQLQIFHLAGITDLIAFFGDIPLTLGVLVAGAVIVATVVQNVAKILKVYNKMEVEIRSLKAIVDPEKVGNILARLTKIEEDINNVADKSRNSDRILLQHINSHCYQINHMGSYLESKLDYHPPTKMTLPDDMIQ